MDVKTMAMGEKEELKEKFLLFTIYNLKQNW